MGGDHPCPVCKATFTRPQHVARHMRSHTGDRPYKCTQCGDQFARSDLLSRHVNKCHSNNPPPASGRGQASKAHDPDDKRRACDQCNHSKVRCDYGSPCGKCIVRKTICTYAKPARKPRKPDPFITELAPTNAPMYPGNLPASLSIPQGPIQYLDPAGLLPSHYGLTNLTQSRQLLFPPSNNRGDMLQGGGHNNPYDSPSPNAPSLTMSASTLESAGSSPDPSMLSASPAMGGANGRAAGRVRAATVPSGAVPFSYQQHLAPSIGAGSSVPNYPNGLGGQAQNSMAYQQQYMPNPAVNVHLAPPSQEQFSAMQAALRGSSANNSLTVPGPSDELAANWAFPSGVGASSDGYQANASADPYNLSNLVGRTRRHYRNSSASSTDGGGSSDWTSSSSAASSSVHLPGVAYEQAGEQAGMSSEDGLMQSSVAHLMPRLDDPSNFLDSYSRPSTASDAGFSNALDGLSLEDANLLAQVAEDPALYEQFMNSTMPFLPMAGTMPTGQTPDLWATFMSEPLGTESNAPNNEGPPTNGAPQYSQGQPQGLAQRAVDKNLLRPQLLSRLSKRSSMPNLVTPFGSGATPRAYPHDGGDTQQLHAAAQQHPHAATENKPAFVPPSVEDTESLKKYQEACMARAAPVLKMSPRVKGRSPSLSNDAGPTNLASTLGIYQAMGQQQHQYNQPTSRPSTSGTVNHPHPLNGQRQPVQYNMPGKLVWPQQQQQQQQPTQPKQPDFRPRSGLRPPGMPPYGPAPIIPALSPQTRFLSQSLLASNSPQRPSNKRLPSSTLGPDNAKRTVFHHVGEGEGAGENEYAVFDDDAEFFALPANDEHYGRRMRRQSAPSLSPPMPTGSRNGANGERRSGAPTLQRVDSGSVQMHAQPQMLVNEIR